jgi:chaperonin GroES
MSTVAKKKAKTEGAVKLQPLGDRIVVEQEAGEAKTTGGIFLPDAAKDKPSRGRVVSVGNGRLLDDGKRAPLQVKVGDRIIFSRYSMGDNFKIDDEEYMLLSENDVLAVID